MLHPAVKTPWFPKWNLSPYVRHFARADLIVVSFPKSGRTWVNYFLKDYNRERQLATGDAPPRIHLTHDLWEHFAKARRREQLLGKRIVPPLLRRRKRVVLLVRDPRDVIVSLYFQMTRREQRFSGSISEFIRHPVFGIDLMIFILNKWMSDFGRSPRALVTRYEALRKNPEEEFTALARFVTESDVHRPSLAHAVDASSFQKMREAEASGAKNSGEGPKNALKPRDPADPESFKVRKGKVGGYTEYLSPEDVEWLDARLAALDPELAAHYARGSRGA